MSREPEVLVVGGGPAGLAAGIAARQAGFEVTLVDARKPPIDKACGEGLLPDTLAALWQLGISLDPRDGRTFQGIRFLEGATSFEANFRGADGFGVRRTVLHQKMVEQAAVCGVSLLWNTRITGLSDGCAIVEGEPIRPKWIVGADGIHSSVRRWAGLETGSRRDTRFAQRRHYQVEPWAECVEVYWGRKMQAYVTPLGNQETCVVLISRDPHMRFAEGLREFPRLSSALDDAKVSSLERGAVTAMLKLNRVHSKNVALIGDASGSVDAITGEGLGMAFRQALALGKAMKRGALEDYHETHRKLAERPQNMARLLLLLDRFRGLRRHVFSALAEHPDLFESLLAAHTEETLGGTLVKSTARLGYRLLTLGKTG